MERRPHTRFESLHLYKWISRKFRDKPLRDLVGKTVIITGANTAIGKETALELARRGARIILAYQDAPKARVAVKHISTIAHNSEVKFYQLNLTSMKSIRNFAKEVLSSEPNIHILINNADVICTSYQLTEDGYEMQFGVNHLGHFLLTLLLLECLVKSAPARVINVTSSMYKDGETNFETINCKENYDPFQTYCTSKLANVLFTRELSRHLKGTGVTTFAVDPGPVRTEFSALFNSISLTCSWPFMITSLFFKSAKQGARTSIYCATSNAVSNYSGYCYSYCQPVDLTNLANNTSVKTLWQLSEEMTGVQISKLKLKKNY